MNTQTILAALIGAALVVIGVLAGALADRIRSVRKLEPRQQVLRVRSEHEKKLPANLASAKLASDVISTLVTAGYSRAEAEAATEACAGSERSTIDTWTRAALRKAMKGA